MLTFFVLLSVFLWIVSCNFFSIQSRHRTAHFMNFVTRPLTVFTWQNVVTICRSNLITEKKISLNVFWLLKLLLDVFEEDKKKKKTLPYLFSVRICCCFDFGFGFFGFFLFHSYVSQHADKYPISLVWNIWQQVFPCPDGKDRISGIYFQPVAYNFVGPDSSMHVDLSLSICHHLIKHMFKSSLQKGCIPEKRSRVMLLFASDSELR